MIKGAFQNRSGPRTPPYIVMNESKPPGTYRNYSNATDNYCDASIQRNLFLLTLYDGDPSPEKDATANVPESVAEQDTCAEADTETGTVPEGIGRPRRAAKPTTNEDDYFYF